MDSSPDPMVIRSWPVLLLMSRHGVLAGLLEETPLKDGEGGGRVLLRGVDALRFLGLGVAGVRDDRGEETVSSGAAGPVVSAVAAAATTLRGLWRLGEVGGEVSRLRLLDTLGLLPPTWLGPATGELGRDAGRSPRPAGRTFARKADWAAVKVSSARG